MLGIKAKGKTGELKKTINNQEEELKIIKHMIQDTNDEKNLRSLIVKNPLKPVEKKKLKASKRIIAQTQTSEINHVEITPKIDRFDKSILDDKDFRKTIKKEKISIDCDTSSLSQDINTPHMNMCNRNTMKSLLKIEDNDVIDASNNEMQTEKFNQLVKEQMTLEYHQVHAFLLAIDLVQYFETFLQNGVDCLGKIKYLNEDKLKAMDIPYPHRTKLLKRVQHYNSIRWANTNNNEPSTHNVINHCEDMGIQSTSPEQDFPENDESNSFQKALEDFRKGKTDTHQIESNEKKENMLFQQAVESFRNANKSNQDQKNDAQTKSGKGFLYTVGGNDQIDLNSLALFEEHGVQALTYDKKFMQYGTHLKTICWACFKIIYQENSVERNDKLFCNERCVSEYEKNNIVKCNFCEKEYIKSTSIFHQANAYCSLICFESAQRKADDEESLCTITGKDNDNRNLDSPDVSNENELGFDILDI